MNARAEIDFRPLMGPVARALLGDPNAALSKPRELRFGARGSLSVNLDKGIWHDHEASAGGGVLDLIRRETGAENGAAIEWLRDRGLIEAAEPPRRARIVATYDYVDGSGELLFQVCRFDPKDFRQRRPDPAAPGGWSWKLGDVRRVLYRLPEILDAHDDRTVFIVEGEKDADRLASLGLIATTNAGGAKKWRVEYAAALAGRRVVILPDNDEAGREHAAEVRASLQRAGVRAAVLDLDGLPRKGDVSDWLDRGGDAATLTQRATEALREAEPRPRFYSASDLAGQPVPPREWHVGGLIPAGTVTMLGGDGGTGKSLLALQLAVATAAGREWIGRPVERPGGALFVSAEDDEGELHRRLADIASAEGLDFGDLDALTLRSLAGEDALLATLDRKGNVLTTTPLFDELDERLGEDRPELLILDTLADLHSGEENSRAHARQFVGFLRGLAIRHGCAVLLLAHPSLTGMSTGSGLSGSTAWSASVRSRLYLERIAEEGFEPDPDARRLVAKKANYARTGAEIGLNWRAGVFVADAPETGLDRMAAGVKAQRVFMRLLRQFAEDGRYVSASPSTTYAPTVFARHPEAEGISKRAFASAMDTLFAAKRIAIEAHGKGAKARSHIVEVAEAGT
jgi:RecA-family ATPase